MPQREEASVVRKKQLRSSKKRMLKVTEKGKKLETKKLKTLKAPASKFSKGLRKRKPEGRLGLKRTGSKQQ